MILAEIANFIELRRTLGAVRAELLALAVAERIADVLPDASVATVGRNLIELSSALPDQAAADVAMGRIRSTLDAPLTVDGVAVQVDLTLGVGFGGADETAAIEAAEAALQAARAPTAGPVPAAASDPLVDELAGAIERGELFVQYQPKLHVRRQEIVSVEALIRWLHPRQGLIPPGDFIPAAERSPVIETLTLWTLRQVMADQRVLARNGHDLPVFVNIAGGLLSDEHFIATVVGLVEESGAKLGFEITETSVIHEPERAIRHLRQLADVGIAIAIDDYGAGLSSLAYLKQLPARELKIDKLFVTQLSSSHRDPLIVRSTIDLAHALGMEVVAEGVETPTALALLSVMGCDMAQGFLISRPVTLDALLAYLRDRQHLAPLASARTPTERLAAVRARA